MKQGKRGKLFAAGAMALGVLVIAVTAVILRNRILEWWYLRKLETSDGKERIAAIESLGAIGCEEALSQLVENDLRETGPPGFSLYSGQSLVP